MRTRPRATIENLRLAIDCLPRRTREAMLAGIAGNDIIVGAYANGDGICPMLAAHRAGGRTGLIAFADAWDRVAFRGSRTARARRATHRELLILTAHLEASLLQDDAPVGELAAARHEHLELRARRRTEPERPGEPHRAPELAGRPGWAWTRVVRRYDEYERILERLETERETVADAEPAGLVRTSR
ncbi:MAG TPA: hypothetical protein VIK04_16815 [Solirubrobacteraceae bacterium]